MLGCNGDPNYRIPDDMWSITVVPGKPGLLVTVDDRFEWPAQNLHYQISVTTPEKDSLGNVGQLYDDERFALVSYEMLGGELQLSEAIEGSNFEALISGRVQDEFYQGIAWVQHEIALFPVVDGQMFANQVSQKRPARDYDCKEKVGKDIPDCQGKEAQECAERRLRERIEKLCSGDNSDLEDVCKRLRKLLDNFKKKKKPGIYVKWKIGDATTDEKGEIVIDGNDALKDPCLDFTLVHEGRHSLDFKVIAKRIKLAKELDELKKRYESAQGAEKRRIQKEADEKSKELAGLWSKMECDGHHEPLKIKTKDTKCPKLHIQGHIWRQGGFDTEYDKLRKKEFGLGPIAPPAICECLKRIKAWVESDKGKKVKANWKKNPEAPGASEYGFMLEYMKTQNCK